MRSRSDRAYVGGHREVLAGPVRYRATARAPRRGLWRRRWFRAAFVAGMVLLGVVGVGGSALAYWHATGVGAGSAVTDTAAALTLTPGTPTAALYPGGSADVALVMSNPNAVAVTVGSLALAIDQGTAGFAVDTGHSGCDTAALSYATQTNAGAGWSVPARTGGVDGTLALTLPNAVAMDAGAADACQGATFTVYLVAGS